MSLLEVAASALRFLAAMSLLEWFAAAVSLMGVWLTVRQSVWCWPVSLVGIVAYAILFFQIKLYADAGLQGYFFATSLQGWRWWSRASRGRESDAPTVGWLTVRQRLLLAMATVLCGGAAGWLFSRYTDAHIPYWDAACAGVSITAQAIQLRKKIECWPLWLAVDTVYVGIYVFKHVYLTAGLYALFLILAVQGWRQWARVRVREPQERA